jgi:hypothetical protein
MTREWVQVNMEDIHVACRSFAKSVNDYIDRALRRRRGKRRLRDDDGEDDDDEDDDDDDDDDDDAATVSSLRDECNGLVRHANLVLRTLAAKRASLSNALAALRVESEDYVGRFAGAASSSSSSSSPVVGKNGDDAAEGARVEIVRRWFAAYVRLRDGFVLLESGERRHDHDDDGDDSFPSRLRGARCSDGYTRKFKSERGYTGRGYDEAYDPQVGIRARRLLVALSKLDGRPTEVIDEELFGDETAGGGLWEKRMDEHINESKALREELNSIAEDFRNGINRHYLVAARAKAGNGGNRVVKELTLNIEDKFERIKLGDSLDISRRGNDFSIKDKGGSLPIGMSVDDWREKFSLSKKKKKMDPTRAIRKGGLSLKRKAEEVRTAKKQRKATLEDSSEDDDDDVAHLTSKDDAHDRNMEDNDHDDGLMVRVRVFTDVSGNRHRSSVDGGGRTTSISEIKRQLGVDAAELTRGHEQLEDEQLLSTMAANEEDMLEGILLRDGDEDKGNENDEGKCYYSILAPLIKQCYTYRNEIRKNMQDFEQLREMQDYCSDFDDSAKRWDDRLQSLIQVRRKEIANGLLNETSDRVCICERSPLSDCLISSFISSYHNLTLYIVDMHNVQAYNIRDNFREANMLLGIDSMEVYEFFSRLQKKQQTTQRRFTPNSSSSTTTSSIIINESLSKACHSFLVFAHETFRTALNLVLEHERFTTTNSPVATIDNLWEKGQHILLRGRAHNNIGQTIYELARSGAAIGQRQVQRRGGGQVESHTHLLIKASDEFDKAVAGAKSIRHNTLLIRRHPNATDTSSQSINSWTTEAILQLLEAMKLEVHASGSLITCLWKLGNTEAMKERFHGVFESVEISDVMNFASTEGVSRLEVVEVVCDVYSLAMRVAGLSTERLESLSVGKGWDLSAGETLFQIALTALNRASMISNQLLKFDDCHSFDYVKERDIAKADSILQEENEIRKWWETTKVQASTKLADVSRSGRVDTTFPRGEVSGELGATAVSSGAVAPRITKRIIIRSDGKLLQNRSTSCRTTRFKKKDGSGDGDMGERFSSGFHPSNKCNANAMDGPCTSVGGAMNAQTVYRKWGNEVLEEHERKRCCPALPDNFAEMGISVDVIRVLEERLGHILPVKR